VQSYFTLLRDLCAQHQVKLIATTHDQWIINQGEHRIALSATYPGKVEDETQVRALQAELGHLFPGDDQKGVRLVVAHEGASDERFIRHVAAAIWGKDAERRLAKIRFQNFKGDPVKKLQPDVFQAALAGFSQVPTLRVIRDHDFDQKAPAGDVFFWKLPTIESYIFVHRCLAIKKEGKDPLEFMRNIKTYGLFFDKYIRVLRQRAPDILGQDRILAIWETARVSASKSLGSQTAEDYIAVAQVIHGHSWVEYIHDMKEEPDCPIPVGQNLMMKYLTAEAIGSQGDPGGLRALVEQLFAE